MPKKMWINVKRIQKRKKKLRVKQMYSSLINHLSFLFLALVKYVTTTPMKMMRMKKSITIVKCKINKKWFVFARCQIYIVLFK